MSDDSERKMPTRVDVEKALREVGLSHRQARRMVAISWPDIVGEEQAEADEIAAALDKLRATIGRPVQHIPPTTGIIDESFDVTQRTAQDRVTEPTPSSVRNE